MSEIINWAFLKNHGDERLEFEHFCFHVASCMFEDYGKMEYFYGPEPDNQKRQDKLLP